MSENNYSEPMQSSSIAELATALSEFQYALEGAKKDSSNPFFKSKYADLQSCQEAIREPLHANGLAVTQTTKVISTGAVLVTTLMHSSGQWIKGELPIMCAKERDAQAQGSAITYARRYALSAITGLYQTDDDGESSQNRQKQDAPKTAVPPKATAPAKPPAATKPAAKQVIEGEEPQDTEVVKPAAKVAIQEPPTDAVFGQILQAGISNGWTEPQVDQWLMKFLSDNGINTGADRSMSDIAKDMTWKQVEVAINQFVSTKPV